MPGIIEKRKILEGNNPYSLDLSERRKISLNAGVALVGMSGERRRRTLILAGYSPDEIELLLKRLAVAGAASGVFWAGSNGLALLVGGYYQFNPIYEQNWLNPTTWLGVAGSEVAWLGSVAAKGLASAVTMKGRARVSTSILATGTGMLAAKALPENKKAQDIAVAMAGGATDIVSELPLFLGPLAIGQNALIGANIGGVEASFIEIVVSLALYRSGLMDKFLRTSWRDLLTFKRPR